MPRQRKSAKVQQECHEGPQHATNRPNAPFGGAHLEQAHWSGLPVTAASLGGAGGVKESLWVDSSSSHILDAFSNHGEDTSASPFFAVPLHASDFGGIDHEAAVLSGQLPVDFWLQSRPAFPGHSDDASSLALPTDSSHRRQRSHSVTTGKRRYDELVRSQQPAVYLDSNIGSSISGISSGESSSLSPVITEYPEFPVNTLWASHFPQAPSSGARIEVPVDEIGSSRAPSPLRSLYSAAPDWSEVPALTAVASTVDSYSCAGGNGDFGFARQEAEPSSLDSDETATIRGGGKPEFTCDWASCKHPGFDSRDGLNWHVKAEHLLICPVPGCCEAHFQSKKILDCHVRVAHPPGNDYKRGMSTTPPRTILPSLPTPSPPDVAPPDEVAVLGGGDERPIVPTVAEAAAAIPRAAPMRSPDDDRALKMTLSVATTKRRCKEQLRAVMEKRAAKQRAAVTPRFQDFGTPRSADSPAQEFHTPRVPLETASFPLVWEHGVLPFLIEFVPKWCGPGHVISVSRGRSHTNARRVCIMTKTKVSRARRVVIASHVRDLLTGTAFRQHVTFVFSTGDVQRLMVWARGLGPSQPDEVCKARNPFAYKGPCMGDSIGATATYGEDGDEDEEITATLGPSLVVGGANFWLANFHPFVDVHNAREVVTVEHPSPMDRRRCVDEGHEALLPGAETQQDLVFKLGAVTATSGIDLKTARLSHDPYWEDNDTSPPFVLTDWTLVSSNRPRQANMLRRLPSTANRTSTAQEVPVTTTSPVVPGGNVITTGRTSGHQRGQVCEVPAYLDGARNDCGYATREWYIEEPFPQDDEEAWIRGGIGIPGDSGAAVVDADTNSLIGQVWGRNAGWGPGPRHTYFTPISDIFDDIQEKCGEARRPSLPLYRDESERWAVYPACMPCFELAAYLEGGSRRGSRESLRSMLGGCGSSGAAGLSSASRDQVGPGGLRAAAATPQESSSADLSELLTPKDYTCLRYIGPEDSGGLGSSMKSPSSAAVYPSHHPLGLGLKPGAGGAGSPAFVAGSPYPAGIDDEDLYDPVEPVPLSQGLLGLTPILNRSSKRPAPQHHHQGVPAFTTVNYDGKAKRRRHG